MSVPVWRMKQLQDIEHAAREVVETWREAGSIPGEWSAIDRLIEALEE
jgi:hypothetical protein